MKGFIKWLAKVFKVNTEKEVVKEKKVYIDRPIETIIEKVVALEGTIYSDVTVKGNLIVEGFLKVEGDVSCFKIKGEK